MTLVKAYFIALLALILFPHSAIAETTNKWPTTFRDWWQTPSQQANRAWQQGDFERLEKVAPTKNWRGAAAYRKGDFETANEAFSAKDESIQAPDSDLALRQQFNQATTQVQLGDYTAAIENFDTLLEKQPANEAAIRNRAIAKRLLELEHQLDSDRNNGEGSDSGEQSDDADKSESDDANESSDSQQQSSDNDSSSNSEDEQSGDRDGQPNYEPSDDAGQSSPETNSADDSTADSGSQEDRDAEIEDARQALQNADTGANGDNPVGEEQNVAVSGEDEPLSEQDQATEQWLRQIPDDPDDLLRRKLLQNHRSEYPDVQVNGRDY